MPRLRLRDGGGILRTILRVRMRDSGNTLRTIQDIKMRDGGSTLRVVFTYLSVTLNTYYVSKTQSSTTQPVSLTTSVVTGTLSGGIAPYTYTWTLVGSPEITIATPINLSTTFYVTAPDDGVQYEAVATLTVADANGATADSPPLDILIRWNDTT